MEDTHGILSAVRRKGRRRRRRLGRWERNVRVGCGERQQRHLGNEQARGRYRVHGPVLPIHLSQVIEIARRWQRVVGALAKVRHEHLGQIHRNDEIGWLLGVRPFQQEEGEGHKGRFFPSPGWGGVLSSSSERTAGEDEHFCPECASDSLVVGGSVGGNEIKRRISITSSTANSSCKSGRSVSSHSTYLESMPYIDGDGKPGHYTGHVDVEGQPTGRGLMKYINGSKFDGVWYEGTKLHGKTFKKLLSSGSSNHQQQRRRRAPPSRRLTPSQPPTPPPTYPPLHVPTKKRSGVRTKGISKHADVKLEDHHRISRRDVPTRGGRDKNDEGSADSGSSVGGPRRRSLSRLRRKCDEIESLLRGHPTSVKDTK